MSQPSRTLWLGLGCREGTSTALIQDAFETLSDSYGLGADAFIGLATLERKSRETGLLEFSRLQGWPILFLTPADLEKCTVPNPSQKTQAMIGLSSVAEAAALVAANSSSGNREAQLLVPKQSFQLDQAYGAVTLAVAQIVLSTKINSALGKGRES